MATLFTATKLIAARLTLLAALPLILGPAMAQSAADTAPRGAGIRSGNITATGATVPNPGVSQSGGTTSMDRGIQAEDTRIQGSICKGC